MSLFERVVELVKRIFFVYVLLSILLLGGVSAVSEFVHLKADNSTTNVGTDDATFSYSGSEGYRAGKIGSGFDFDNAADYITSANLNMGEGFNKTNNWTIAGWLKQDVAANSDYFWVWFTAGATRLSIESDGGFWQTFDGGASYLGDITATSTNWIHITLVNYGSTSRRVVYANSVLTVNESNTGTFDATSFRLGASRSPSNFFDGIMDDIRMYTFATSQTDIDFIYNSGTGTQDTLPTGGGGGADYFLITATDNYGNSINTFNATMNSTTYTTTTGTINTTILNNVSAVFNITFEAPNYFNSYNSTVNISSDHKQTMIQSQINIQAYKKVEGTQVLNFTINDTTISSSTTTGTATLNLLQGNNNLSFRNSDDNYNTTFNLTVQALDNFTYNYTGVYNHKLNVTAKNNLTGAAITTYTINISSGSYFESLSTTTGQIIFNLSKDRDYNATIDADGYAIYTMNITNLTGKKSNYVFNIKTTNSITLTFINAETLESMNGTNVTVQFIGDTKITRLTDNGSLYVDLFIPDEYTIVYSAVSFRQGQYIISIDNRTTQSLTLYLEPTQNSTLVLLTVRDIFGTELQGADITIQRYLNNSWITENIVRTDFQGKAESYFVLSTEFYNFLVSYQGTTYFGIPNSDPNKKVIYAEDVVSGLNFYIDLLGATSVQTISSVYGVEVNLSFQDLSGNNSYGRFRFYWDDPNNNPRTGCLQVTQDNTVICPCSNTSTTSESSVLFCDVNPGNNRKTYRVIAFVDEVSAASMTSILGYDTKPDWGLNGFWIGFIIVVASFFIFLYTSPSISIIFGTVAFSLLVLFGVILNGVVEYSILIVLLVIAFIIATIKSESGING